MYRMVRQTPLYSGQKYGDILKDGDLKPETIQKMLESGTLVRVVTPPLSELPNWGKRAELLESHGIITLEDVAKADVSTLAKSLKKPPALIQKWQNEVMEILQPTPQTKPKR